MQWAKGRGFVNKNISESHCILFLGNSIVRSAKSSSLTMAGKHQGKNQSKYKMSLTSFKSSKLPYLSNIKRCLKLFYVSVVFKRQNKLFCRCFQFDFFVFFSLGCKTNEIAALVADKSDV